MFRSNLKIAFRNIVKHRSHSIINICGLTIGITIFLIITMFIRHELSYDKDQSNYDRIFKLTEGTGSTHSGLLAPLLQENIPEIENTSRLYMFSHTDPLISYKEKNILVRNCAHVDSTFTSIFSFPIILGDKKTPLRELYSIVLTESISKKVFGDENPIGKIIQLNNSDEFKVTAVLKDLPENTTFKFTVLISKETFKRYASKRDDKWGNNLFETYLLAAQGVNRIELQDKINGFLRPYFQSFIDDWESTYYLHSLQEVYFNVNERFGYSKHGDFYFLQIFFIIAFVVLIIAIINFINLSSAKASIRSKEIGVRKVLGSFKSNLINQFLSESILLSIFSSFLAIVIVEILKPSLVELTGIHLNMGYAEQPIIILFILVFSIILGILSGIFPALFLSSIKITSLFKNISIGGKGSKISRSALIVIQFAISMIFIFNTIVIIRQLAYLNNRDIGYDRENIIFLEMGGTINGSLDAFKQDLLRNPSISKVSFSHRIPGKRLEQLGRDIEEKRIKFNALYADPDYLDLMGLELIEGRNFSKDFQTDLNNTCIVNEKLVKEYQLENPVGKLIELPIIGWETTIVGVVKDFHFKSLHYPIEPLSLVYFPRRFSFASIKIIAANPQETLTSIEESWKKFYPTYPFNYNFMDEYQKSLYKSEDKLMHILVYFTFFAIFIACMGLYGLVSFITERRSKEIGIRKVYGASIATIVFLITKDITKWIAIAFIIACPLAYWIANKWLGNFAFQSSIPWWIYAVTGILGLFIGLLTLSFEAYKAGVKNPVDSLKYE